MFCLDSVGSVQVVLIWLKDSLKKYRNHKNSMEVANIYENVQMRDTNEQFQP